MAGPLDIPLKSVVGAVLGAITGGAANAVTAYLLRPVPSNYNPADGGRTANGFTTYDLTTSPPQAYDIRAVDGQNVKVGDFKVIVAAQNLTVEPATTDFLQINGTKYRIANVNPIMSGAQACAYTVQCRK